MARELPSPIRRAASRALALLAAGTALLAASGCTMLPNIRGSDSFLGLITPYRMDIVQGNVVTREQAEQVKPGMTRAQVRDILGSPMLTDIFHGDRWDYAFTIRRQGTEPQRRSVVAIFDGNRLERLEASDLPSEQEFVATISKPVRPGKPVPVLELTPEQRQALPPPPPRPPAPEADPAGPVRDYPPLEPT